MVDFAKMNEISKKRDKAFNVWRDFAFPGKDWKNIDPTVQQYIYTAFVRGFGQGFAEGTNDD